MRGRSDWKLIKNMLGTNRTMSSPDPSQTLDRRTGDSGNARVLTGAEAASRPMSAVYSGRFREPALGQAIGHRDRYQGKFNSALRFCVLRPDLPAGAERLPTR